LWGINLTAALAQEPIEENEPCLACHSNPDIVIEFPDGSTATGHIGVTSFSRSVHGQEEMTCSGCHPDHEEYPHPTITAASSREFTLQLNEICADCHPHQEEKNLDSVHAAALSEGNLDAAVCVDCHGAHDTLSLHEARVAIAATCRNCHASVYDEYVTSAHGKALTEEQNTDVPTCVDCHGVHNVESPHTTEFRLQSPNLCASCHADEELMAKYDISTDVFETYVADFHGSTVTLFEQRSPDAETNKAVCYDCHGVHAILSMDNPEGIHQSKENLLVTCQKCHPDATINFPDSWTSHFRPTFEHQPLVATVNLFYLIVIPATIGVMGLFVLTDAGHRLLTNGKRKHPVEKDEASNATPQPEDSSEDAS
jgi:predicted CXXCH cytochrome family protein